MSSFLTLNVAHFANAFIFVVLIEVVGQNRP